MKITRTIDISDQRHNSIGCNAQSITLGLSDGDSIKISYDHAKAIVDLLGYKPKK